MHGMKALTERQKRILDFIEEFLEREGMAPTVYEIADNFGIKTSTVFAHLKALQRKNQLSRSSKARSISLNRVKNTVRQMSFVLPVPLLGRINAGMPADSPEVREGEVYVTGKLVDRADQKRLFALRVHGESMRELGIYDEDVVVVNPGAEARPGDIVVALVNNETTVKSYFPLKGGRIELRPANAEFSTQVYPANQVQLQGRVIALQREY